MARPIVLSNGTLCVTLDARGDVRDLYYPYVGHENHVRDHYQHRVGVWADGRLSWLSDSEWHIEVGLEEHALISSIVARNENLGIELVFSDTVQSSAAIFSRSVEVHNLRDHAREIKLYFAHQFEIQKMHGSDTAYYDPASHSIIHYKGRRVFLIGGALEGEAFNDYGTGRANFHGLEGSHRDAEDGLLSKNPIEHGPADSIIGFYAMYEAQEKRECDYWVIAAQSIQEAHEIQSVLVHKTPAVISTETRESWNAWVKAGDRPFADLDPAHISLFHRSMMYARAHADARGGIIASVDSEMFQYGLDTYSYVWMRDSAYVALSLASVGELNVARRFLVFCKDTLTRDGYFMHKYMPDTALGSSWHPWILNGRPQLPIQEDETAIVIYALAEYIRRSNDLAFLSEVYPLLVEKAGEFLITYRDQATKLPLPSYDLWERKRGTSTYTSACVYGGLKAASELARKLGKEAEATRFEVTAEEVREGILKYLWREEVGMFCNTINTEVTPPEYDAVVDISSVYGVFIFGVLPPDDMRLKKAFETSVRRLGEGVSITGLARFENDDYYRIPGPSTGNPWFVTTLWYAEYVIASATHRSELLPARDIFSWVTRFALPSGVLSEQLDPTNGNQVCAGPLAWSHAAYVSAVGKYLDKAALLGGVHEGVKKAVSIPIVVKKG